MKTLAILLLLGVAACATPPARYNAYATATQAYYAGFQQEAREVRQMRVPEVATPPAAQPAPRRRARSRQPVLAAAPAQPDCSVPASLTGPWVERCRILERQALTELGFRHASAMASYFSALAVLATRFDPAPGVAQVEETRLEAMALGEDLIRVAQIDVNALEAYRPVEARSGLRAAFASEMLSHGWQIRRQWQIHDLALARLVSLPGGDTDAELRRLRAAAASLREGFEALVRSDAEALPLIAAAQAALRS